MQLGSSGCKTLSYFSPHSFILLNHVVLQSCQVYLCPWIFADFSLLYLKHSPSRDSVGLPLSSFGHISLDSCYFFQKHFLWPPYPKINTLIHVLSISFSVCLLDQLFGHLCIHLCAHLLSLTNDTIELIRGILHIKRTKLHHCE